ncbi:AHNAK2 isoform, putative [Babesia ovis]|uniref:AHNAK2 isoform, putative n=1 Tax=Babesia ovis TaxID=5869 RepID=A0A9W5TC61_BABOV|nr:AHNAK2 isoform, putative [Babesia ovis]
MASTPRDSTSTAVSAAKSAPVSGSKDDKAQTKLPRMFTHQVLIGFLNDIFSSCTFTKCPSITAKVVDLVEGTPSSNREYILVLRFEKKGVLYELVSHDFAAAIKGTPLDINYQYIMWFVNDRVISDENMNKVKEVALKTHKLSTGMALALLANLSEPTPFHQVPTAILKTFVPKTLNRGGLWAYMSLPCFLGSAASDQNVVHERQTRTLRSANDGIPPITSDVILSLLRALHFMKADKFLRPVCDALCQEYLACHSNIQTLPHVIHFGSAAGVFTNEFLAQHVNANLNNVNVLSNMPKEDLVLLLGSFSDTSALNLVSVRKILMILADEIEMLSAECTLSLAWVLVKLGYKFGSNIAFTRHLLSWIGSIIEELPRHAINLLYVLGLVCCDLSHFNQILDSMLLKFHLIDQKRLILIGASYAYAKHLLSNSDALRLSAPRSGHIFHCLEFHANNTLWTTMAEHERLIPFIFDIATLPADVSKSGDSENTSWPIRSTPKRTPRKLLSNQSGPSSSQEEFISNKSTGISVSSNSFKLYYLNLLEDCCLRFEELDFDSLCLLLFSLLVSHIDVSPLHEAMLVAQGLMLRKGHNPVQIQETPSSDLRRQHELCYAILQYSQHPTDNNAPLEFGSIRSHYSSPEPDPETVEETKPISPPAPSISPVKDVVPVTSTEKEVPNTVVDPTVSAPIQDTLASSAGTSAPSIQLDDNILVALASLTAALKDKIETTDLTPEDVLRKYLSVLFPAAPSISLESTKVKDEQPSDTASSHWTDTNVKVDEAKSPPSPRRGRNTWRGAIYPVNDTKKLTVHPTTTDIDSNLQLMYTVRPVVYHRITLVKRRASIYYTYVKVHTRGH